MPTRPREKIAVVVHNEFGRKSIPKLLLSLGPDIIFWAAHPQIIKLRRRVKIEEDYRLNLSDDLEEMKQKQMREAIDWMEVPTNVEQEDNQQRADFISILTISRKVASVYI